MFEKARVSDDYERLVIGRDGTSVSKRVEVEVGGDFSVNEKKLRGLIRGKERGEGKGRKGSTQAERPSAQEGEEPSLHCFQGQIHVPAAPSGRCLIRNIVMPVLLDGDTGKPKRVYSRPSHRRTSV
jgi:hypothetical protein